MPPGTGGGGETTEGALGPLSPDGTWQGSSGLPRRPGSPEDSERDTPQSPWSPGCRLTGTHSSPALQGSRGNGSLLTRQLGVYHVTATSVVYPKQGGTSFLPGSSQSA